MTQDATINMHQKGEKLTSRDKKLILNSVQSHPKSSNNEHATQPFNQINHAQETP